MQATQLLAQRIDIGLGRIQRDLPLWRQPSAGLTAQQATLLSPLHCMPVTFQRQRLALFPRFFVEKELASGKLVRALLEFLKKRFCAES